MIVHYTNQQGFKYLVAVPDNTAAEYYSHGAIIGPPDLSELGLVAADLQKLHNGLVDIGVYNGDTLDRAKIRQLLKDLKISLDERWITAVFVREYF